MCSFVANDVTIVGSSLGKGLIHFPSHVALYEKWTRSINYFVSYIHPIALFTLHEEVDGVDVFFLYFASHRAPFQYYLRHKSDAFRAVLDVGNEGD